MMNQLARATNLALRKLENIQSKTVVDLVTGAEYPCIEGSLSESVETEIGGNPIVIKKRLLIRASDDGTLPAFQTEKKVRFPGSTGNIYRIAGMQNGQGDSHVVLDLVDPNANQ